MMDHMILFFRMFGRSDYDSGFPFAFNFSEYSSAFFLSKSPVSSSLHGRQYSVSIPLINSKGLNWTTDMFA